VKSPRNLEEAEANFGIERIYRHRKQKESTRRRATFAAPVHCDDCGKRGYRDEEAARIVIGQMLHCGRLTDNEAFSFKPYQCPHGWWHTGHDPNTRRLFRRLKRKERVLLTK
jgi:hypothetical protein